MIPIRLASLADEPALLRLLGRLAASSAYTDGAVVNQAHLADTLGAFLRNPNVGFVVADRDGELVGLLALVCYRHLLSGDMRAAEICWWADVDARRGTIGRRLLERAEAWARERGAVALEMMAPARKFAGFYRRRGYQAKSHVYERSLSCRG